MNKQERAALKAIIKKIQDNTTDAWESNLQNTASVVVLEDFNCKDKYGDDIEDDDREDTDGDSTEYNGWLEDLIKLSKSK